MLKRYTLSPLAFLVSALGTLWFLIWVFGPASAHEPTLFARVHWNCENMQTSNHPLPINFTNDASGNWDVYLEDGSMLYGTMLNDGFQKWTWEDASWITDGKSVVYCESDAKSISILLSHEEN